MLQIGFGSVLVGADAGIAPKFELTRQLGGQFIEFYYQEMDEAGYGPTEWREIGRLSAAHGLPVTYHLPWDGEANDLGRYDGQEGVRRLDRMMDTGFAIGAKYMILHLGAYPLGEPRLPVLERVLGMAEAVIPRLAQAGAVLCLENNTALYTRHAIGCSVFEMDTAFARIRSPHVGMCLDTGHAHVNGCLMEMTEVMAPHIRYVHLHDNDGVRDAHQAPGLGNVNWPAWYAKLAVLPQSPWVMFEYPRAEGYANTIEAIRAAEGAAHETN